MKIVRPTQPGPVRRPLELSVAPGTTADDLLRGYVDLVRGWRGPGPPALQFRQDDLVVLVGILGTDAKQVERRLIALTGCTRPTAKRFRRLFLAGVLSLPVGLVVPVMASPTAAAPATVVTTPAAPGVGHTANAAFDDPPHLPAFADTTKPTVPAAPTTPTATAVVGSGVEAVMSIPHVGIDLPIVLGGQAVIDQGTVAHYTAEGWRPPVAAGDVGTYWLAAHHLTHGSPFADLPAVAVGDLIHITTARETLTYTVTSTEVVLFDAGFGPVYGSDPAARVILLQTCLDHTRRLLVHGTLTARS